MTDQDIKAGNLVVYKGGLFRFKKQIPQKIWDDKAQLVDAVLIGDSLMVKASEVRKADWRDVQRITKGGYNG